MPQNEVLLELSHNCLFIYCLLLFLWQSEWFLERHYFLQSPKYLLSAPFQKVCRLHLCFRGLVWFSTMDSTMHFIATFVGRTVPHLDKVTAGNLWPTVARAFVKATQKVGVLPHLPYCEAVGGA